MRILCFVVVFTSLFISCKDKSVVDKSSESMAYPSERFYVGTYTDVTEDGGSEGIYTYSLGINGKIEQVGLAAKTESPSFLTRSADGKYIMAVNEVNLKTTNQGTVESYKKDGDRLLKIGTSRSGGAHPCHISSNEAGFVLVSNYTGGNVGLLKLNQFGVLSDLLDVQNHQGSGSHERQDAPHAHSAWFTPWGDLISVDLGTNELWFSEIADDKFQWKSPKKLQMKSMAGPRHIDFHPNGRFIYVLNELNNTVGLLTHDAAGYNVKESYSTLPATFSGANKTADIHVSSDGRFVYASNRGHNSLAIFRIDQQDGALDLVDITDVKGDGPRNFQLSPDGSFIIVANEKSGNIVSFKRDTQQGTLMYVDQVAAPAPVCILF